jgi:hypothetical protein
MLQIRKQWTAEELSEKQVNALETLSKALQTKRVCVKSDIVRYVTELMLDATNVYTEKQRQNEIRRIEQNAKRRAGEADDDIVEEDINIEEDDGTGFYVFEPNKMDLHLPYLQATVIAKIDAEIAKVAPVHVHDFDPFRIINPKRKRKWIKRRKKKKVP